MVRGIDVSMYQGQIDWSQLARSDIRFVISKVTDGIATPTDPDPTDPRFAENWKNSLHAGMMRGAYVFSRPAAGRNPATEVHQALAAIEKAGGLRKHGDLPLVVDLEWDANLSASELEEWVKGWIRVARQKTGRAPIIYTGSWWRDNRMTFRVKSRLWLAAYVDKPGQYVPRPSFRGWAIWQKSDKGHVPGVTGEVDIDVVRSLDVLRQLANLERKSEDADHGTGGVSPPPLPPPGPTPHPQPHPPTPPKGAPKSLPVKFYGYWAAPWKGYPKAFKDWLWDHGYVSPHFTRKEWACRCGTPVPSSLRKNAQRHGENVEKLRHELGDKPLSGISFYRPDWYNRQIGGATASRHVQADAMNISTTTVEHFGRDRFMAACRKVGFGTKIGGLGVYPGGSVHVDSRGYPANWTSW